MHGCSFDGHWPFDFTHYGVHGGVQSQCLADDVGVEREALDIL